MCDTMFCRGGGGGVVVGVWGVGEEGGWGYGLFRRRREHEVTLGWVMEMGGMRCALGRRAEEMGGGGG